jgi:ATP phosphoribosyltransferase
MSNQQDIQPSPNLGSLRLAIPSDGEMYQPTQDFLRACGMPLDRPSPRSYTARISGLSHSLAQVVFQRAADITSKIEEQSADLGIVGLDRYTESFREDDDAILIIKNLGYSHCELVVAVPDTWVDVIAMSDLADLSVEFRESGRELRVATKYPRLVERYLYQNGLNYFTLIPTSGTLEAAPIVGYADIIVDLTSTGTTLRENRLKTLQDGSVLTSQAALIGNIRSLRSDSAKLKTARYVIERIESRLRAQMYHRVSVNVKGKSQVEIKETVKTSMTTRGFWNRPGFTGLNGPTVSPVIGAWPGLASFDDLPWFTVTVIVPKEDLLELVDYFRSLGGSTVSVSSVDYIFQEKCEAYDNLLAYLGK